MKANPEDSLLDDWFQEATGLPYERLLAPMLRERDVTFCVTPTTMMGALMKGSFQAVLVYERGTPAKKVDVLRQLWDLHRQGPNGTPIFISSSGWTFHFIPAKVNGKYKPIQHLHLLDLGQWSSQISLKGAS